MKKRYICFILLLGIFMTGQKAWAQQGPFDYEKAWKKVDSLITKKGLPKSARDEVNKIRIQAGKERNEVQLIRSLVYELSLKETLEEDSEAMGIESIKKEISGQNEPAKSILYNLLASSYWRLFQSSRYVIYEREHSLSFDPDKPETWSATDFHREIGKYFLLSLSSEELLKKTKIESYEPIIVKGNSRKWRPTLYDLLAHSALEYFRNDERDLYEPAYYFEITDPNAFQPAAEFSTYSFSTEDSSSLYYRALCIYQDLLKWRIKENNPEAFVDLDLDRLSFVHQYARIENKDNLYIEALEDLLKKFDGQEISARIGHEEALQYFEMGNSYPGSANSAHRFDLVKAREICNKVLSQYPASEAGTNCFNLLQQIDKADLKMQSEKVNLPNQPFRMLVEWKNFKTLYYRIIRLNENTTEELSTRSGDEYWKYILSLPSLKSEKQELPLPGDFQTHRVEIKIDALAPGHYALLGGSEEQFNLDKHPFALQIFQVSNISYIRNGSDYFVLNRETGIPLEKASVQVYETRYNYQNRKQEKKLKEKYTTNQHGYFQLSKEKENSRNISFEISWGKEKFVMGEYQYFGYRNENEEEGEPNSFLFTDRGLYRPGQTVYFKGIVIVRDSTSSKYKVVQNFKTTVGLYDANGQKVDSVNLRSNEFGSYHGSFRLPANLLNGSFSIEDEVTLSETNIQVEDYKRPKFFVSFDTTRGSYRLGDTVISNGKAVAFAGNMIDGAKVKYQVTREAQYPFPWFGRGYYGPREASKTVIAHGELETGADGSFSIRFQAAPDPEIPRDQTPIFEYHISTDITDQNGETQSGDQWVRVGYQSMELKIELPNKEILSPDSLDKIKVKSQNLAGSFERANVSLAFYPLNSPDRLIRKRYWSIPDTFVMTKLEYIRNFPHDEYENESDVDSWEKMKVAYEYRQFTRPDGSFSIKAPELKPGWYKLEAVTVDRYGDSVGALAYFEIRKKNELPSIPVYWTIQSEKNYAVPGDKVNVEISTSIPKLFILQKTELLNENDIIKNKKRDSNPPGYEFIQLNRESKDLSFPVTESAKGGFGLQFAFVRDNRFFQFQQNISVPYTDKELDIEITSYRDRIEPGAEEEWKVKVKGTQGEKIAAELLTTMYDASLDKLYRYDWFKPPIYPYYYLRNNWDGSRNFMVITSNERWYQITARERNPIVYDQLIWANGLNLYQLANNSVRIRGMVSLAPAPVADSFSNQLEGKAAGLALNEMVTTAVQGRKESVAQVKMEDETQPSGEEPKIQIRKNFNETAFFFPDLRTDSSGNISFSFKLPESLTTWRWLMLAHSSDLAFGMKEAQIIAQKKLMVQPNFPRFFREGDQIHIPVKISNLQDSSLTGEATLELFDPETDQPVDGWFQNLFPRQYFTTDAGKSTTVDFSLSIPFNYNRPLSYRVVAKAGKYGDGEENIIPVLSNRILITESLPLYVKGNQPTHFRFEKLLNNKSESLTHHQLTVEYSTNPAWYAIQSLPYLTEFPYECAEQLFNRYYANSLSLMMISRSPRIQTVLKRWEDEGNLKKGPLDKNETLKSILLEETPWLLEAKNETQQIQQLILLFDSSRMEESTRQVLEKIKALQSPNGGFVWFKGGPDDRFITQYILSGIGHLKKLDAFPSNKNWKEIISDAIRYLDKRIEEDHALTLKDKSKKELLSPVQIQYLYMRSFFPEIALSDKTASAIQFYLGLESKNWLNQNRQMQAMISLSLYRSNFRDKAKDILRSLKENSITDPMQGMYWKEKVRLPYWYLAPVETQALLIEAFLEVGKDMDAINQMKAWLLFQKQTTHWGSTKATAEACYALLMQGNDWLVEEPELIVRLGEREFISTHNPEELKQEAGTGYISKSMEGKNIESSMGDITIQVTPKDPSAISWGAVYWQYFENLDLVKESASGLQLRKTFFRERTGDKGPELVPVSEGEELQIGDKLVVRMELTADRDYEYVHLKDLRASGTEPLNVISAYKWQGGIGYYEMTKDVATHFFINHLGKGKYVFDYPVFVSQAGNFSAGVATIQCMYAPSFSAHSEGSRIKVSTRE